jgi:hypothetical protein
MRFTFALVMLCSFNALADDGSTVPAGTVVQCNHSAERLCEETMFLRATTEGALHRMESACSQSGGQFTRGQCSSAQHIGTCRYVTSGKEVKVRAYALMQEQTARENCNRIAGGNFSTTY